MGWSGVKMGKRKMNNYSIEKSTSSKPNIKIFPKDKTTGVS